MGQGNACALKRQENWPIKLSAYLHECRNKSFKWGELDCLLFASGAVNAITGVDYAAKFRGAYTNRIEAEALIEIHFNGKISNVMYEYFGDPLPYSKLCQRGDVVIRDFDGICCAGIVDDTGAKAVFLHIDKGLIRLPIDPSMIIWGYG